MSLGLFAEAEQVNMPDSQQAQKSLDKTDLNKQTNKQVRMCTFFDSECSGEIEILFFIKF